MKRLRVHIAAAADRFPAVCNIVRGGCGEIENSGAAIRKAAK